MMENVVLQGQWWVINNLIFKSACDTCENLKKINSSNYVSSKFNEL